MATNIVLSSASKSLPLLYKSLVKKDKERFDTIVEPLQCVLQLVFLAFSEKNTKITIQKNLVYLQFPSNYQGIMRWYQNDSKEDLYFLFNAIRRFSLFYKNLENIHNDKICNTNLYDLIVHYALIGLQNLIDTYTSVCKPSLLYTLQMYKVLLETPDNFKMETLDNDTQKNIDDVFNNIRYLYNDNVYYLIYHFLFSLTQSKDLEKNHSDIIKFNEILLSKTGDIQNWISKNVIY